MDKSKFIWTTGDLAKAVVYGLAIGFLIGAVVGYDIGHTPVVKTYKPLIG